MEATGIQFGSEQPANGLAFIKQVVNASASSRFMPTDHHPLVVDGNFRAGWLASYGALPLAERFFGGNVPTPFIPGDAWVIQSNPILRSFPAHDFTFAEGPWGGTSFFSANSDVSYAIWGRPLIPTPVAKEVEPLLQGQMKTFKNVTADSYVADTQQYKALEVVVANHAGSMAELQKRLLLIKNQPAATSDLSSSVDDALDDLDNVDEQMKALGKRDASADALSPLFQLVLGEGAFTKGYFSDLANDLSEVLNASDPSAPNDDSRFLAGMIKDLQQLRESVLTQYKATKPHARGGEGGGEP